MKTVPAGEFKQTCLRLLDEVAEKGERVIITKRGRVVAELVPAAGAGGGYPQDAIRGQGAIAGDIVAPPLDESAWEALRPRPGARRR